MYKIALLDTETWNTTISSALMEVACLVYDIEEEGAYWKLDGVQPLSVVDMKFNFQEQMNLGRTFSADTVEFHAKFRGWEAVLEHMKSSWATEGYSNTMNILGQIRNQVADCEEIWINGLSFDPPILRSLLADACKGTVITNMPQPAHESMELWHFRKERDLRGFRKVLKLCKPHGDAASHHAYADCEWMARQLVVLGSFLTFGVHDEQMSTELEPERLRRLWVPRSAQQLAVESEDLESESESEPEGDES